MDPALGPAIASGRTAEIYAWGHGRILKLFREDWPREAAEYEARVARAVHAAGVRAPAVGELVELEGRSGLIYERVDGPSMLSALQRRPWALLRYARLLAELQAAIHASSAPGLPSLRERLATRIRAAAVLPPATREAVLSILARLPAGDAICHGDFHPDNVLLTAHDPVVIDWNDATCGNPLADVARTSLLLSIASLPPGPAARLFGVARGAFHRAYLRRYAQLRPYEALEFARWRLVVAAARLAEKVPGEEAVLVRLVEEMRGATERL